MKLNSLDPAVASMVLEILRSEELPEIAVRALEEGHDSQSLRLLAGLTQADAADARELFAQALAELGWSTPSIPDALACLAKAIAGAILDGSMPPQVGARRIWDLTRCVPNATPEEFHTFVYAASEWDERPEMRSAFEEGILAAARDLVEPAGRGMIA